MPPGVNASSTSMIMASKLGEASCDTTQSGSVAIRSIRSAANGGTPRCGTATPLGLPVEPDV